MVAFEWMALTEEQNNLLIAAGIFMEHEYTELRLSMRHPSTDAFLEWAVHYGVGYVTEPADLMRLIGGQLVALRLAAQYCNETMEIDLFDQDKRSMKSRPPIRNGIKWKDLPSGARYYYSPYDAATVEGRVWLVQYWDKHSR
jgi:hypothetical protein